jgi:hypothetical protein
MNRRFFLSCSLVAFAIVTLSAGTSVADVLHLFILSGQSNMAGLNPQVSFIPTVQKEFGAENTIVVKDAVGGQPIRRWFKQWKPAMGDTPAATGDLYDRLMTKVAAAVGDKKPTTVTFVWMQGERDAKEKHGNVYGASLRGLIDQLQSDLGREDINFVIGRLSDFDNDNKSYSHWTIVRDAQVKVAADDKRGAWVETDDLNGEKNGLHYNKEGYAELGKRFADESIKLIKGAK